MSVICATASRLKSLLKLLMPIMTSLPQARKEGVYKSRAIQTPRISKPRKELSAKSYDAETRNLRLRPGVAASLCWRNRLFRCRGWESWRAAALCFLRPGDLDRRPERCPVQTRHQASRYFARIRKPKHPDCRQMRTALHPEAFRLQGFRPDLFAGSRKNAARMAVTDFPNVT